MANTNNPTSASDWKKQSDGIGVNHQVEVPSGNVALCRRPGLETFVKLGLVPNSLLLIVQSHISKAQAGQDVDQSKLSKDLQSIITDPKKMADMFSFADKVLCFVCVEPKVNPVPEAMEDRQDDLLYADEVAMEDKMFIFQWAMGGTESLESFRGELLEGLGIVPNIENVEL